MKKIFTVIMCFSIAFLQAQSITSLEDLIANSTETPSPELKIKMPLFYSNYDGAKSNDEQIKKFFFLDKNVTKSLTSVMSGNLIFINQDSLLKSNDKMIESKAIISLFYSIGFIHSFKSGNFLSRDTEVLIKREIYIAEYVLNRAIDLNDGGSVLKIMTNKIKANGLSTSRILYESAKAVTENALYTQILNYTKTTLDSDKPKEHFDLTINKIQPQINQVSALGNNKTITSSVLFLRPSSTNQNKSKIDKLMEDFDVVEDFTSKSTHYRQKHIGERFFSSTLFLTIQKISSSYLLQVHIIYVNPITPLVNYIPQESFYIKSYSLNADKTIYQINNIGESAIRGNGNNSSTFVASLKDEEEVKFFELLAKAKNSYVYYNGDSNTKKTSLSSREKKHIEETLNLFNELTQ